MGWLSRKREQDRTGKSNLSVTANQTNAKAPTTPSRQPSDNESSNRPPVTVAPARTPVNAQESFRVHTFALESSTLGTLLGDAQNGGNGSSRHTAINPFLGSKRVRDLILECCVPCAMFPLINIGSADDWGTSTASRIHDLLIFLAHALGKSELRKDLITTADVNEAIQLGAKQLCDSPFGFLIPEHFQVSPTEALQLSAAEEFQVFRLCRSRAATATQLYIAQGDVPPPLLKAAARRVSSQYHASGLNLLRNYKGNLVITEIDRKIQVLKQLVEEEYSFDPRDNVFWQIRIGKTKLRINFFASEKQSKPSNYEFPLEQLISVVQNDGDDSLKCWLPIKIKLEYKRQGTFHRFHTLARYEGRLPLLNLAFPGSQPRGILALHAVKFITSSYLRDPSTVTKGSNSSNTSTIAIEDCIVLNGKLDPPLSSGLDELLNSVENGTAAPEGTSDVEIVGKSKQQNGSAKRSKWFSTGKSGNSGNSTSRWFTTKASSLSSVDVSSSILHQLATNSQSTTSDSQSDPVLALSKLADIESGKWSNETPSPLIYLDGETNNPSLLYVLLLKFIIKESNPRMSVPEANALQNNLDGFSLELDTRGIAGVSLSENDLGSPLGSDDEIVNGEEYSFGPISQHEGSMLLDEFAVAHGLSSELRDGALLAILAHSCEHALDAATFDSGREPQLPVMLNMIKEQADKVLHVLQQRDVNLLDKFSLGLIATACRYLDSNLIATIARQRHVICTGLHFEDGTFGSLIRALEAVEQLGQVLPDDVRPSAFTPPLIPTLVRVSKAMLAEVEDMYKTMKIKAIRDVGYETRDDPSIVSPNSHESIPSTGSRVIEGTNSTFKCERFSVDLPLPTRSAKVQSDGMNNSSASLASLVEASNPHAIASAAFRKGCVGSMIWGIRLRESTMQGLVEVESIAPASAAAMAVAMSPIQPIAQSASGFSSSPYLRQPKQGDLLIAVAGENVIGWNLERIQRLIQEQVHREQDGPNSSKPISGLLPDVLEFTFQSPLSTTDRVVLPPPPTLMNADGLGSVSPHSGAQRGIAADGILQVDIHQFRGKFKHATIKRATEHALLFKVQVIVGTSSSNTTSPRRCLGNVYANDGTGESDQVELIFQDDEEPWNVSLSVMNAMRDSVDLKLFSSHKPYFGKRQWYLEAQCGFDLRRLLPNDMGNVTETKWVPSSSDEHCEIRATFRYTNAMQHITTVTSPSKSSKRGRFIKRPGFTSPRLLTSKRKKKSPDYEIEKLVMQPVEKEDDLPRSVPGRRQSRIHSISITKATTARQTLALAELIKDYLSKELSLFLPTMMMIFPWEKHQASWALVHQETPRAAHLGFPESLHVYTLSSAIVNLLFTQLLADTTLVLQSNPPRFDSLNESLFPLHQTLLDMLQSCSTKHSSDWPILSRAQEESLAGSIANLFKPYVTSWIEATWRSVRDKYVLRIVDSIQEFTNVGSSQSQVLFAFEQDARQLLAKFGRGQRANDLKWIFQETYRVFFSLRFEHDPVTLRRYCKRLIRDPINLFVAKLEEYLLRNIVEREGKLKEHWEHMLLEWNNQNSNEANQDDGKSSTKKKWKMPRMGKSKTSTKNASSKTTSPASDVVGNRESEQSASKLYDSEDQMDELVNDVVRVTSVHESGMSLGTLWSADMACFMNDLITLEDAVPGLFKGFQSLCLSNVSAPTPNREDDGQKLLSMHRFMIHVEKIAGGPVHNRDPLFITAKVAHTMDEMESGYYRKLHTRACRQGTTLDEALLFDISCSDPILRLDLVRAFDIKDPSTYKTEVVGFLELPLSAFPVVVDASSGEECNIADQMYEDQWWAFRAVGDDVHGMNLTGTSSQDLPPVVQVTKRSTPRDLNSPIDSPLSLPEIDVQLPNSWGISPGLSRKPTRSVASSKPEKENSSPRVVGGSSNTNLPRTGDQVLTVDVATELPTSSSSKSKKRFSFPKFSTLRNKSKILSPRGTYSRRFNRKPNPIVDSPNTTSQSVSDDPLTPNNGDDGAMVFPEETFEESTNWDSTKVRLAIQHTRVSLQENSEDILYEAINRVCDVFSNSLCNALRPLVRQACIVSLGTDEGDDLITYSEARASLLGTLDQQLSRFHKCIQLVSTSHPCFRRVLLHTFRGLSVQLLEILLPAVNVQRLIGLEGEVNRISSRIWNNSNVLVETTVSKNSTNNPKRRVGSHRMTRHTSSKLLVNHNRLLQRQDTDNGQVEKQSKKLWKKVLSPKNRNTQRGTKSPKSMSFVDETKSTIETQFGVLPYMDEIAHLVDRLKSYFHADGAGLSDSILQCDPYGPDQLRIVVRNLQDDMTAPSERSDNISVMLRQMGSSGLGLPDPDTRNSVVMLFREWLCCKCIEASLPPQPPASTKSVGDPNTQTGEAKRRRSLLGRRVGKTTNVSLSGSSGTLERLIEDPLAQQSFEELINGDIGEDEEGIVFIHEWISTLIAF